MGGRMGISWLTLLVSLTLVGVSLGLRQVEHERPGIENSEKIFNGEAVNFSDFPSMAAILVSTGDGSRQRCTAVIIAEDLVMTSASCLPQDRSPWFVCTGASNLNPASSSRTCFSPTRAFQATSYSPDLNPRRFDLLLVQTQGILTQGEVVAAEVSFQEPPPGTALLALGYGPAVLENDEPSVLRQAPMEVVDVDECTTLTELNAVPFKDQYLCAKATTEAYVCAGDVGGPLLEKKNGKLIVYGIVSFGRGDSAGNCLPDAEIVYQKTANSGNVLQVQNALGIFGRTVTQPKGEKPLDEIAEEIRSENRTPLPTPVPTPSPEPTSPPTPSPSKAPQPSQSAAPENTPAATPTPTTPSGDRGPSPPGGGGGSGTPTPSAGPTLAPDVSPTPTPSPDDPLQPGGCTQEQVFDAKQCYDEVNQDCLTVNFGSDCCTDITELQTCLGDLDLCLNESQREEVDEVKRRAESVCAGEEDEDAPCFPATAEVLLADGRTTKKMEDLESGDRVRVGVSKSSDVFGFSHRITKGVFRFVRLEAGDHAIELSSQHYLPISGQLKAAGAVKIGDLLTLADGSHVVVDAVKEVMRRGLFNPQTIDGSIVVNNVVASTFTQVVHPTVARFLLLLPRLMYRLGIKEPLGSMLYKTTPKLLRQFVPGGPTVVS